MSPAPLDARDLGKRFRREWGLRDCTLTIPQGAIVGLAGPNAARPTDGGRPPSPGP